MAVLIAMTKQGATVDNEHVQEINTGHGHGGNFFIIRTDMSVYESWNLKWWEIINFPHRTIE